ncbi:hypothetical protein DASC09_034170 [Saccharomycopsis crataegensis]|uniref:Altered inheritance of mitochondria protein 6 n=1 Tax=Saccharomycopsis crataegensis TaxID=43959 RepID=A0AAV5QNC1_9ASCO|nr:hypothetical protein DASC09_034170 [Saccharomycopsis crataegensis]
MEKQQHHHHHHHLQDLECVPQKPISRKRNAFIVRILSTLLVSTTVLGLCTYWYLDILCPSAHHNKSSVIKSLSSPPPSLVKRSSSTAAASVDMTPATCPLAPRGQDNAANYVQDPNSYGGSAYFAKIMDYTQPRNRAIHAAYYDWNALNKFKQSEFYTSHINKRLVSNGGLPTTVTVSNGSKILDSTSPISNSTTDYYNAYVDSKLSNTNGTYTYGNTTVYVGNSTVPPNVTAVEYLTGGRELVYVHSHNDYTRKTPLFDALQRGYKSVEADLWYFPGSSCDYNLASLKEFALASDSDFTDCAGDLAPLYVSHKDSGVKRANTLKSMYLDTIEMLLDEINEFYGIEATAAPEEKAGVFFDYPTESLNVLLDFKHNGFPTYKLVMRTIQSLIEKNYVSYYDFATNTRVQGPVTFILSGVAPYDLLHIEDTYRQAAGKGKRYVFIDAPMAELSDNTDPTMDYSILGEYTSMKFSDAMPSNYLASNQTLTYPTVAKVKPVFDVAHKYGLKTRLWGMNHYGDEKTSDINVSLIKQCGLNVMNVDDLDLGVAMWKEATTTTVKYTDYGVN